MKLTLYPRKRNLIGGIVVGVGCFGLTAVLPSIQPQVGESGNEVLNLLGGWLILYYGYRMLRPKPSFEADMDGFSVQGSKTYPWSQFRGVALHGLSVNFIPSGRWVVVKVGKGILGRKLHIKWTQLSASPKQMVSQIAHFADVARAVEAQEAAPVQAQAAPMSAQRPAQPAPSIGERLKENVGSPVSSVPTLSERLFGRRKVL